MIFVLGTLLEHLLESIPVISIISHSFIEEYSFLHEEVAFSETRAPREEYVVLSEPDLVPLQYGLAHHVRDNVERNDDACNDVHHECSDHFLPRNLLLHPLFIPMLLLFLFPSTVLLLLPHLPLLLFLFLLIVIVFLFLLFLLLQLKLLLQ